MKAFVASVIIIALSLAVPYYIASSAHSAIDKVIGELSRLPDDPSDANRSEIEMIGALFEKNRSTVSANYKSDLSAALPVMIADLAAQSGKDGDKGNYLSAKLRLIMTLEEMKDML